MELPTYAFDRRRFWLSGEGIVADAAGLGLGTSEHPLLSAVVELPASGGVVLTGRLSPSLQGWLADHAVSGVVVFPGAGFVELAIRAGDEVGCSTVDELTLQAPLMLPAKDSGSGSVAVQVVVGAAEESGRRSVSIFSRADAGSGWVCHAEGALSTGSVEPSADLSVWPPAGAVAADLADGYERLAARGYGYGPAFQGLTATWVRGDEVFAEVRLPDAAGGVNGFGVHPALLDAAMHALVMTDQIAGHSGRSGVAVLVAGRVVACRRRIRGARAHRAGEPPRSGLHRACRRAGIAGAVGAGDGGPSGERAAAACGGVGRGPGPAVRGGVVAGVRPRSRPLRLSPSTNCLNPLRPNKIRWPARTSARMRCWLRCSLG